MPRLSISIALLCAASALACSTENLGPDTADLSGVVRDYFADTPIADAVLKIAELPLRADTSKGNGSYLVNDLATKSTVTVLVTAAAHIETRNLPVSLGTKSVVRAMFTVGAADALRQYTAVSIAPTADASKGVFVELKDTGGVPREGIPVADITLVNQAQNPVGAGPFIFGIAGDIVPVATLAVTTAFNGRSRVGFLDVPPGIYTLRVVVAGGATLTRTVVAEADGVTLVER